MSLLNLPDDNLGLLSLGLRLMSTPGSFGQALGNAGHQTLGDMQAWQANKQKRTLLDLQTQQTRRQLDDAAKQDAWFANLPSPQMQAAQQGLAGGGGPTMANAAAMPKVDPMQQLMFDAVKNKALPVSTYLTAMQKDTSPLSVAEGTTLLDRKTMQPLFTNPKKDKDSQSPLARLLTERDALPPGSQLRAVYDQMIAKTTTHQPPNQMINYGTGAQEVILPDGTRGLVQLSGDPKAPPKLVALPGGSPLSPPPKAPPAEFSKSVTGLQELQNGLNSFEKTLKDNSGSSPVALGKRRAALQGAFTALQMGLKNAFELGALAGPDLDLLNGMLVDPTSVKATLLGDKGIAEQISQARQYLRNRAAAVYKAQNLPLPPEFGDKPNTPAVVDFGALK